MDSNKMNDFSDIKQNIVMFEVFKNQEKSVLNCSPK